MSMPVAVSPILMVDVSTAATIVSACLGLRAMGGSLNLVACVWASMLLVC